MNDLPVVIGITGGIASGKSEVRRQLEALGCLGIDADKVGHSLFQQGSPTANAVLLHFGDRILTDPEAADAQIDRKKLGAIVFSDPAELAWLESVTHPVILERILEQIRQSDQPVALEAIKLMQTDMRALCDERWLVRTDAETCIQRMIRSRGVPHVEAEKRIQAQQGLSWNDADFDRVFDGSIPLAALKKRVSDAFSSLMKS